VEPSLTLYDWGPSPFSLKVRAVLDRKGLAYRRLSVLNAAARRDLKRRGKVGKAPALDIDGTLLVDSTDICHALERRFPAPPLLPAEARPRALCHAIEEWSDESLYFVGLYFQWFDPEGRKMVPAAFGGGVAGALLYRFFLRRILRQLWGQGTGRKSPAHVRADLDRHLDAIEALIGDRPFALGDAPYLCDFALLGQLVYLARTPVGGRALAGRPGLQAYLDRLKSRRAGA
jgi:glutathione S-transferase